MSNPARVNLNELNSKTVRQIQEDYRKKNSPAKLSIEAIVDTCVELGAAACRKKFNLDK